jgi:hypothetical protein
MNIYGKVVRNGSTHGYLVVIPFGNKNVVRELSIKDAVRECEAGSLHGAVVFNSSVGPRLKLTGGMGTPREYTMSEAKSLLETYRYETGSSKKYENYTMEQVVEDEKIARKEGKLYLYHGTTDGSMKPVFGRGNPDSDFGIGLYTTRNIKEGIEWACKSKNSEEGFLMRYKLKQVNGIKILDLSSDKIKNSELVWLATIIENRKSERIDRSERLNYDVVPELKRRFGVDIWGYDIIKGCRADDKYFDYAIDCIADDISIENLRRAMKFGGLGEQIVLKTKKAFELIEDIKVVRIHGETYNKYCRQYNNRVEKAEKQYYEMKREIKERVEEYKRIHGNSRGITMKVLGGTFLSDVLGVWKK